MSRHERRFHLTGWLLFIVCAVCFIRSAMNSGDAHYLAGSIVFLLACIVFIIPLLPGRPWPLPGGGSRREATAEDPPAGSSQKLDDRDTAHYHQGGKHPDDDQSAPPTAE